MESKNRLEYIVHSLIEFRKLWLLTAIAGLGLATFYAFFIQGETWTSRQTMIIRDDLLGQPFKPGSFISEEAMKSAQETVLETARRPEVIRTTLEKLGPETKGLFGFVGNASNWPSDQDVEDFRGAVSFESANGGEFGKSEVIVLATQGSSPQRAIDFISILTEEIDAKLSEIRADRFESMEAELRATRESTLLSRKALQTEVMGMERELGIDITLVRSMNERSVGSPSAFETKLNEIYQDMRAANKELQEKTSHRQFLANAQGGSDELPTSSELLASQPILSELVTSLAKAKQDLAEIEGQFNPAYPPYQDSLRKVRSTQNQIRKLIPTIIGGLDNQIEVLEQRIATYQSLLDENAMKIANISQKRVPYATLTSELEKLNEDYSEASTRLTRMKSRKSASASIRLLTRIGEPWVGTRADGLGKRMLSLVGAIAGLVIGLGLVLIVAPPFVEPQEPLSASAQPQEAENASMRRLGDIVSGRPRQEASPNEAYEEMLRSEAPASQVAPVAAAPEETDLVIDREVMPQSPPAPQLQPEPQLQPQAGIEPQVQPATNPISASAPPSPSPVVTAPATTASVPPVSSSIRNAIAGLDGAPLVQPEKSVEESVPSSNDTMEAMETMETPDFSQVAVSVVSEPAVSIPSVPAAPIRQPRAKSDSKTLAAIFANMPQPKTDVPASTATGESGSSDGKAAVVRDSPQTIQLGGPVAAGSSIPLQRRTATRPVDLAKVEEPSPGRQSIDSVFSQLTPPPQLPQERMEPSTETAHEVAQEVADQ